MSCCQKASLSRKMQRLSQVGSLPASEPPSHGWPLLVFLHGQGESSGASPLQKVALQGPPQQAGRHAAAMTQFAILSPQKPLWTEFYEEPVAAQIMALVDEYTTSLSLNPNKICELLLRACPLQSAECRSRLTDRLPLLPQT